MTIANVSGQFTANGQSNNVAIKGQANLSLWGTFAATVTLQRSFDDGATWLPVAKNADGDAAAYTAPVSLTFEEPESGVLYRLACTYTSGTVNFRISQ